jgi:antitoxin (DNA-binding transcriptional repressor) of toxin-antitoxin stability system
MLLFEARILVAWVKVVEPVKRNAMSEMVIVEDAKSRLSELVDRAAEGEEFVISKNGVATDRMGPIQFNAGRRKPAGALGLKSIAEDFDAPIPNDLQAPPDGSA